MKSFEEIKNDDLHLVSTEELNLYVDDVVDRVRKNVIQEILEKRKSIPIGSLDKPLSSFEKEGISNRVD